MAHGAGRMGVSLSRHGHLPGSTLPRRSSAPPTIPLQRSKAVASTFIGPTPVALPTSGLGVASLDQTSETCVFRQLDETGTPWDSSGPDGLMSTPLQNHAFFPVLARPPISLRLARLPGAQTSS